MSRIIRCSTTSGIKQKKSDQSDHQKWLKKHGLLPKQIKEKKEKIVASDWRKDYIADVIKFQRGY